MTCWRVTSGLDDIWSPTYRYITILITVGLLVIQIALGLLDNYSGVSIVWSAQCGFSLATCMHFSRLRKDGTSRMVNVCHAVFMSCAVSIALWVYYALVEGTKTTMYHLSSAVLGVMLGYVVKMKMENIYREVMGGGAYLKGEKHN